MIDSRGYAACSATTPLAPYRFDRRDPGPKDIQIEILYCGVCHSDLGLAPGRRQRVGPDAASGPEHLLEDPFGDLSGRLLGRRERVLRPARAIPDEEDLPRGADQPQSELDLGPRPRRHAG